MKVFRPAVFAFTLFLFSCSNSAKEKNQSENFKSLKGEAESIESKITWTDELEKGRLSDKIKKTDGINKNVKNSVLSVSAKKIEEPKWIYPSLPGFGSLDTTLIPENLRKEIEKFCVLLSKNEDIKSLVRESSMYNIALFYYDLSSYIPEYIQDDEENAGEKEFFDSYKLGEPFIDGANYNVPLLFFFGDKNLVLETYWTMENSAWLLDQIQISSVGNNKFKAGVPEKNK